ncbi:Uncharacterized protein OBRU01_07230, partial [Operophtera brumata]
SRFPSAGVEEEGVLDLRARDPSVISVGSQHSGVSETAGYLDAVRPGHPGPLHAGQELYDGGLLHRDILDLSMPDKNSMTEVCYVCGDEYKRGTLYNLHTKEPKDKSHPRPPRSRPKDAQGTVRACATCHHHLLQQWNTHQMRGVPANERVYTLRTRPPSHLPPSPLSLASSGDKSLATQTHSPSLERPASQPSAPAATASFVCYVCGVGAASSQLRLVYCCPNPEREPYYPCYVCAGLFSQQSMEWLSTTAEYMNSHAMHFPCLAGTGGSGGRLGGGRVLACSRCVRHLSRQWELMDAERVPLEHRRYNIPSPLPSNSSVNGERSSKRGTAAGQQLSSSLYILLPLATQPMAEEFPFLTQRRNENSLLLENGDFAVVCLDCYESLRTQAQDYERRGVPVEKREYNWLQQPPPPEDSADKAVSPPQIPQSLVMSRGSSKRNSPKQPAALDRRLNPAKLEKPDTGKMLCGDCGVDVERRDWTQK